MRKVAVFIAVFLAMGSSTLTSYAQPAGEASQVLLHPNALAIEFLGRCGIGCITFDRSIEEDLAFGLGVSFVPFDGGSLFYISHFDLDLFGSYAFTEAPHRIIATGGLALGFGGSSGTPPTIVRFTNSPVGLVIGGGYEYRPKSLILFRVGPYLYIGPAGLLITGGLSLGFVF